jgi:hypothetical protein
MKTYEINGNTITVKHAVEINPDTHQVHIRCTFSHDSGKKIEHILTVGAEGQPLPTSYDKTALQKDLNDFKQKHADLFESKIRAAKFAAELE